MGPSVVTTASAGSGWRGAEADRARGEVGARSVGGDARGEVEGGFTAAGRLTVGAGPRVCVGGSEIGRKAVRPGGSHGNRACVGGAEEAAGLAGVTLLTAGWWGRIGGASEVAAASICGGDGAGGIATADAASPAGSDAGAGTAGGDEIASAANVFWSGASPY